MRRIICLVLALCLFPFAGFSQGEAQPSDVHSVWQQFRSAVQETDAAEAAATPTPVPSGDASKSDSQSSDVYSVWQQFRSAAQETDAAEAAATPTPVPSGDTSENEEQPMDGMKFLHRLLFAINLLHIKSAFYNSSDPQYFYSTSTGDGYLEVWSYLFTFDHYERTFKFAQAYYKDMDEGVIIQEWCKGLPAVLFALSSIDIYDEYDAYHNHPEDSFLAQYDDYSVALELLQQARREPVLINGYYLTSEDNCYHISPAALGYHARSSFYEAKDYHPAYKPGMDLYCFYVRYTFARSYLGIMNYALWPIRDFSPEGYACYTMPFHLDFFTKRSTGLEQNPTYKHDLPFDQIPLEDLKDLLAFYFALSGRSILDERAAPAESAILLNYDDSDDLRALIAEYFAPGNIVGDYRMHTQHYTNKSAKTHTLFSAGVNYDKTLK